MIQIKIDYTKSKEFYKKIDTTSGKYKSVSAKIQKWIDNQLILNPSDSCIKVAKDIKLELKKIITESPKGLEVIIEKYKLNGNQALIFDPVDNKLTSFGKDLEYIFNYKSFRKSKKSIWFANSLDVKSCTTCNTQYTLKTNQISGEKLLYHLDHYFPKSVYPFLSLSYYNLIACCASCNMSKSNKPFLLKENIHPYIESFHDIAKFSIDRASLSTFLIDPNKNEDKIEFKVKIRTKYYGDKTYENKLQNYLREFRIDEQYSQFKDVAAETYLKSLHYHKKKRIEIKEFFRSNGIDINDDLFRRFILGNYHQDKDLLKRPLAKFMKDIGEDFNLI